MTPQKIDIFYWYNTSIILLYPSYVHSWNNFKRSHFSIYVQVHTIFATYLPSYILFIFAPSNDTNPPNKNCYVLLLSIFVKKWHFCSFIIAIQGVSLNISMYKCIIIWIGSSPLFVSFLPLSPSFTLPLLYVTSL
jgi:hypothetical protein